MLNNGIHKLSIVYALEGLFLSDRGAFEIPNILNLFLKKKKEIQYSSFVCKQYKFGKPLYMIMCICVV